MSAVRTHRFEILSFDGEWHERSAAWGSLADRCRELANTIWQEWEARHVFIGNHLKMRDWMKAVRDAKKNKTEVPECPVSIEPPTPEVASGKHVPQPRPLRLDDNGKPMQKMKDGKPVVDKEGKPVYQNLKRKAGEDGTTIYLVCSRLFPDLNTTTIALMEATIKERMKGKDSDGRWRMWQAVLAGRQGRPSAEKDQPIPFGPKSASLATIEDHAGRLTGRLDLSIERQHWDTCKLKLKGSGATVFSRIVSGEYQFAGSAVVFKKSKRKWFALIAYKLPEREVQAPGDGVMFLRPGRNHPWSVRVPHEHGQHCPAKFALTIDGESHAWRQTFWRTGPGRDVFQKRRALLSQRWDRQENYRWAGSANKGHGRRRALGPIYLLQDAWKDYVATRNHTLTTGLVKECVERGIGKLVYCQPIGDYRDSRFLTTAGKIGGREDSTGWDWAQVATQLQWKCKEVGIHLIIKKGPNGPSERSDEKKSSNMVGSNGHTAGHEKTSRKRKARAVSK